MEARTPPGFFLAGSRGFGLTTTKATELNSHRIPLSARFVTVCMRTCTRYRLGSRKSYELGEDLSARPSF